MPRGRSPTVIDLTALRFATSITSITAPSSALTYSHLPSGLNTACAGVGPVTLTLGRPRRAAARISATLLFGAARACERHASARIDKASRRSSTWNPKRLGSVAIVVQSGIIRRDRIFAGDMKHFLHAGAAVLLVWGLRAEAQFVDPSLRWRTLD